ncbi:MAG: CPBP family intramembrane glutamic endopeptidase [Spirochaetota bacterium]
MCFSASKKYKPLILIVTAAFALVLFSSLIPPLLPENIIAQFPLLHNLPGDIPAYIFRFLLSFMLLGLFPLITAYALGETVKSLGLTMPWEFIKSPLFMLLLVLFVLSGIVSSFFPDIFAYYPYSHTLIVLIKGQGFHWFLVHSFAYLVSYYLPWELLFRGVLILPFLQFVEEKTSHSLNAGEKEVLFLLVASFQIIPSSLLHYGHPLSESLGAVLFGIVAGYMAVKTRSIIPGLIIHSLTGISLDLSIVVRS